MGRITKLTYSFFVLSLVLLGSGNVFAAGNSTMNQTINAGVLATDIMDASRVTVGSPSVSMSTKSFSFDCQSGGNASTGLLGSSSERIYVSNPGGANSGWTLTLGATSGATAAWANSGASQTFDFNDASGSGCTDGADADSKGGQMSVNANAGTLTADCLTCATTNVSKGSNASFIQGTTDSITLLNASAASDDIWRGYLTGAAVSQNIPAEQPAEAYTLNLTLTSTAL